MNYYFLGIGGIGMSAIARFLHQRGDSVSGYDRTPSPLTRQLEQEGIPVHYDDDPSLIPSHIDLVIYTPAVPTDTAEYQHLQALGLPIKKRSQVLGELTRGKRCIAVAGTHGKTSTSTLIAHLLSQTELGCSAFLGGISKNFGSNLLVNNDSEYVVVEADEYDRSFLQLHPYCAVITATDDDHLDIYGTHENLLQAFHQFAAQVDPEGTLILKQGLTLQPHHHHDDGEEEHHDHDVHIEGVAAQTHSYTAHGIELPNTALYNVENAVAAAAVAMTLGLNEYELRHGFKTYAGVNRRFDYRIKTPDLVYIDDYAHHPQEIAACLESIRYLYPGKRVVGIFQPHLYTRTRDFADQFAQVLSTLDELIMLPIYPARERPILGVTSSMVLRKIDSMSKYLCTPDQVLELVPALCPDVVVTMGAGDIDRLVPRLEETLKNM